MADQPNVARPITNYSGNSNASKQRRAEETAEPAERKKLERVTSEDPVRVRKPLGRRMAESFKGDDLQSVGSFVLFEVILPEAKRLIADVFTQGIERALFGSNSQPRSSTNRPGGYTPYNRMSVGGSSTPGRPAPAPALSTRARARHDFSEIVLTKREDAVEVLDRLQLAVEEFGMATVGDLYDLVGVTGNFNDAKWGWTTLSGSGVRMVRGGYVIDLPAPNQLD